jgi:hypothetical protein
MPKYKFQWSEIRQVTIDAIDEREAWDKIVEHDGEFVTTQDWRIEEVEDNEYQWVADAMEEANEESTSFDREEY